MSSNEHPDMRRVRIDDPFRCENCGKKVSGENVYGSYSNDDLICCSMECVQDWESRSEARELAEQICRVILECNQSELEGDE